MEGWSDIFGAVPRYHLGFIEFQKLVGLSIKPISTYIQYSYNIYYVNKIESKQLILNNNNNNLKINIQKLYLRLNNQRAIYLRNCFAVANSERPLQPLQQNPLRPSRCLRQRPFVHKKLFQLQLPLRRLQL